eukprot:NODE_31654_length_392_cov_0.932075.p3 GENE.NODE_31654_length_392_cov_0.932075~~NODE_31654_length_392_cov_0.932075.p3  ORF type:complete len:91 (-),score=3.10 NODE_31654_length_392_cov_0.932075:80-352(-)
MEGWSRGEGRSAAKPSGWMTNSWCTGQRLAKRCSDSGSEWGHGHAEMVGDAPPKWFSYQWFSYRLVFIPVVFIPVVFIPVVFIPVVFIPL